MKNKNRVDIVQTPYTIVTNNMIFVQATESGYGYNSHIGFIGNNFPAHSLLVIPVSAFFISRIVKTLKQQAQEGQTIYANMMTLLEEALSGVKIIKSFNAVEFIKGRFDEKMIDMRRLTEEWFGDSKWDRLFLNY